MAVTFRAKSTDPSKDGKNTPVRRRIFTQAKAKKSPVDPTSITVGGVRKGKKYSEDELNSVLNDLQPVPTSPGIRSTKEGVRFRRMQVLRLMLRGVPKQTIAEHLKLSLDTVYEDASAITSDMRREIQHFDYPVFIGMSLAFYEEARNIALRSATDVKEKSMGAKMAALRTAIEADKSKMDFLTKIGLFKVTPPTDPFNGIQTGRHGTYSDENDMADFMRVITSIVKDTERTVETTAREVRHGE